MPAPLLLAGGVAAAGLASAYLNNQAQAQATRETNAANAKMAQAQMDFQEKQNSTAHQRAASDLYHAGLNPLLAAGSPAASGSGAQATMQAAPKASVGSLLAGAVGSGMQAYSMQQDMAQKDATKSLTAAQTAATDANRWVAESNATKIAMDNNRTLLNAPERRDADTATYKAIQNEAKTREAVSVLNRRQAEMDLDNIKFDNINRRTQSALGTVNKAVDIFKPFSSGSSGSNHGPKTFNRDYTDEYYDSLGEHTGSRSRRYTP